MRIERLTGGAASTTRRILTSSGFSAVLKEAGPSPVLYSSEAEGLRVLADVGLRAPHVLAVSSEWLLLEDLGPGEPDRLDWERLGRSVAMLHAVRGERFGWEHDGYLGLLPQINTPTVDGHAFFAEDRMLRYLTEPNVAAGFSLRDLRRIERLAARLPELVPAAPPVLVHGDLWLGNVVATTPEPALIDPALHFAWADTDLAMMEQSGGAPDLFFDTYAAAAGRERGWRRHLPVLFIREALSMAAHFPPGDARHRAAAAEVRTLLETFG